MKKNLLCVLIAGALTAHAQVTWQPPATISGTTDVDTNGQYFGSWAPYDGNTYVGYTPNASYGPVNGVNFYGYSDLTGGAGVNTSGSFDGGGGAYYSASSTANPIYNTLLEYGTYANGTSATIEWGDMTPGGLYEVEFWVEDSRNASGRSETLSDGVSTSSPLNYSTLVAGNYLGSYIIGTFIADNTGTETLTLNADASAQVNLLQVRTLLATTPTVSPSTNVYAGATVTISSGITGGTPTSFLWQSNGVNIATSSNLTFTAVDPSSSLALTNFYDVVVVNSYGTMTSAVVAITINPAAAASTVTNEPPPATPLFQGDSVTLGYALGGTPPIWVQWEKDGVPVGAFTNIGQATTVSMTLAGLQTSQAGAYSIIATNQFTTGPLTNSQAYTLTVEPYAQFTWFAPQPITTADAALELFGGATNPAVVFEATGFGGDPNGNAGTPVTLGDGQVITFEQVAAPGFSPPSGSAPGQVATGNGTCYQGDFGTYTGTTGNADFDNVLNGTDNGIMANLSTMTFSNLTPGTLYGLQIFATDDRAGNGAPDLIAFQDPNDTNNVSQSYLLGANNYSLGMFVANGTSQTVNMNLPGLTAGGNILDAAVLYALPAGPIAWDPLTVSPATTVFAGTALTISEDLLTGLPPFTYQWQANGVNIAGATNGILTVTATNSSQSVPVVVNYDLVVANSSGTNTSPTVGVTINPSSPPVVATSVPTPPTLFSGDTVTLSFAVNGTPPLWVEWERNGNPIGTFTNIGGALTTSLTLTALQASQGGIYSVIVTNKFGTVNTATNTQNYTLTVEPYPQFTWFAPQPITTADAALELFGGATNPAVVFEATGFGGDPNGNAGTPVTLSDGQVITFEQVAAPGFSAASGSTPGQVATGNGTCYQGNFGTFTGATLNTDFDNVLNGTDNGIMANLSTMTFSNLTPGTLYGLQIFATDDRAGTQVPDLIAFQDPTDTNNVSQSYLLGANNYSLGMFVANGTSQTVNMRLPGLTSGGDILDAAVLYALPVGPIAWDPLTVSPSTNVFAGTVLTISEDLLTGLPPFTYQWQANGVNIAGATNSVLAITATNASQSAIVVNYDLVVANASSTNTNPTVSVTINPLVPLTIKLASGSVKISWPVSTGGAYVLQTTTGLTQPWTTIQPPYTVVGSQYQVTVSATGTAFYRLQLSQ